jgi:type II secretory pathway component PulM
MATLNLPRGPLAFVDRTLDGLSPRDRKLLVGLVLFFGVTLTFGYCWVIRGFLSDRADSVVEAKETHAQVLADSKRLAVANAAFEREQSRLAQAATKSVPAWVEELAKKHQLEQALAKVTDTSQEPVGDSLMQTHYSVELKKAPQENLYRFVYDMEIGRAHV